MNTTNAEHFKKYFPDEDVCGFDKIYFTQGGEDIFAFILVKGNLEDIRVFTHGEYSEESLEKRILMLVSKYGKKQNHDIIAEDEPVIEDSFIREELISHEKRGLGETGTAIVFTLIIS